MIFIKRFFILLITLFAALNAFAQIKQQYIDSAIINGNNKNYEGVIRNLTAVIKMDSTNSDNYTYYCYRGLAKSNLNRYSDAVADYNKAIKLNPKDTLSYFSRGAALINLTMYIDAIKDFDFVISMDSAYTNAYSDRGTAYASLGRYNDAL